MAVKKTSSDADASPKKKTTRKKTTAPAETIAVETKTTTPTGMASTPRSSKKEKHGGGGVFLFLLIVLVAIAGVYVYQKKQTDSVVNKLSSLESKFAEKMNDIEQGIDKAKQNAEEEKQAAVVDANTERFNSVKYDYSFSYPEAYEVVSAITNASGELLESVQLMHRSDVALSEELDAPGRYVSFQVYPNAERLSTTAWIEATPGIRPDETLIDSEAATEIDGMEVASIQWSEAGSTMKFIAMPFGSYIMVATVSYAGDVDPVFEEAFMTMIDSLKFES